MSIPDEAVLAAAAVADFERVIQEYVVWELGNILLNPTGKPLIHKGRKP